jgi:hypothetical protein
MDNSQQHDDTTESHCQGNREACAATRNNLHLEILV